MAEAKGSITGLKPASVAKGELGETDTHPNFHTGEEGSKSQAVTLLATKRQGGLP